MKRNLMWMLAAILLCGSLSMVFTACGGDDNGSSSGGGSESIIPNTYEVTLCAVLPRSAAPYLNLQVEYTDANGKKGTAEITKDTASENFSDLGKRGYLNVTDPYRSSPEIIPLLDDVIVRNFKFTVPSGKTFTYMAKLAVRNDFAAPTEKVTMPLPTMFACAKRISGNSEDNSEAAIKQSVKIGVQVGILASKFAQFIERFDGREVANCTMTIQ